jgi:hypothetical protein
MSLELTYAELKVATLLVPSFACICCFIFLNLTSVVLNSYIFTHRAHMHTHTHTHANTRIHTHAHTTETISEIWIKTYKRKVQPEVRI